MPDKGDAAIGLLFEDLVSIDAHAKQRLAWFVLPEWGSAWECSCHISRGKYMLEAIVLRHFRHLAYPSNHDWLIPQCGHQALEGRVGQHNLQEASALLSRKQQSGY